MEIDTQSFLQSTERNLKEYFDQRFDAYNELFQQQTERLQQMSSRLDIIANQISELREYRSNLMGKMAIVAIFISMLFSMGLLFLGKLLK